MWEIEYSQEVRFHFLDNHPYTFELLVKIEELRHIPEGVPPENHIELEPGYHLWTVLDHQVLYERDEKRLTVWAVKPLE